MPTVYKAGCGYSIVLNRRSSRWQVNRAPASASVSAVSLYPLTSEGTAIWRTKSSREKQCRAKRIQYSNAYNDIIYLEFHPAQ